ncbi:MAG TPA: phage portal protein [Planctomycetaceae bacterium]|nr:phage portal protein [uncultured Mediterranean phage uvMED]HBK73230.1 phage portal protein [Planctomycetaceae bacterium]
MGIRTSVMNFLGFKVGNPRPMPRRAYSGALVSRLTNDWMATQASADAEIRNSLRRLRDRSRELVRNNPYARQAKRTTQINVIGTGIKLQSQVLQLRGNRRDNRINNEIEAKWSRWTQASHCDCAGRSSFHDFEWLAVGAMCEAGEALFRIVKRPFGDSKVPLALQMLESDLLDEAYQGDTLNKNNEWRNGVEVDQWGRPVRYAILMRHPGDSLFVGSPKPNQKHIFIPAADLIHLFMPERPGQNRGVPWFHSVMTDVHQLQGYEEAAVIRARAGASIMGFITNNDGELHADDVEGGQRISEFEPGTFKYLNNGESITVPDIDSPDQQFDMFVKNKVRRFASGFGCSYETLSRDFSDTNYSSSRLSLLEDREHWRVVQKYLIDNFHMRVYREWLNLAALSGELNLPDFETRSDRYDNPRWMPRGWSWVDPLKEVKAYREAEQAGYMTKAQIIAYSGGDYDDNVSELAREQQLAADAGIKLDKDLDLTDEDMQLSLLESEEPTPTRRKRSKK